MVPDVELQPGPELIGMALQLRSLAGCAKDISGSRRTNNILTAALVIVRFNTELFIADYITLVFGYSTYKENTNPHSYNRKNNLYNRKTAPCKIY